MKQEPAFFCSACNKSLVKWMGRCPSCGEWNTIKEKKPAKKRALLEPDSDHVGQVLSLEAVTQDESPRLQTNIGELDRVLGGGLVRRSVILVGGDPGIGKSTLLMQALGKIATEGTPVLYISGEESAEQIKLRAERLGIKGSDFLVLVENELESILDKIGQVQSMAVVIDSVQSIFSSSFEGHAGSISQVRYVAGRILDCIKKGASSCLIVGHVTKDGTLAGPKVLEHMVDTVLYFEGERGHPYRILRTTKNRFGSANEIGVFEMGDRGLNEVANPSEFFLSERPEGVSGSTVTALMEGTRPILAEIQALVSGPVHGQGRRTCLGTDPQRLALIVAVIEKKLGIGMSDHDIFLNAVGGVKAVEPATDLAIVAGLLSSFLDRTVPAHTLVFGEVGLAGEVRRVSRADARINEAIRMGFNKIVGPAANLESQTSKEAHFSGISHIKDLMQILFNSNSVEAD